MKFVGRTILLTLLLDSQVRTADLSTAIAGALLSQTETVGIPDKRPFTVSDSLEISHFVNYTVSDESRTPPAPIISPDGKHFLLVSEHGVLSTNRIESTIWLFNRQAVSDYVLKRTATKPIPKALATVSAVSNNQVISGVRWLEDSERIAFLGKNGSPYQQLFIVDLTGRITQVTESGLYVSAYDIRGDIIAYLTLITDARSEATDDAVVDVAGKNLSSLLYPNRPSIENLESESVSTYAATLHVQRNGRELLVSFTLKGKPLRLFPSAWSLSPPLSISPDGNFLITLAPVVGIPLTWNSYEPGEGNDFLRLRPGDENLSAEDNEFKPLQFVLIDLRTGQTSPLVDAPAGRNLGHIAPTKVFWFGDSRRALITNTFLPLHSAKDETEGWQSAKRPVVAVVDVSNGNLHPIAYVDIPGYQAKKFYRIDDFLWNPIRAELTLRYGAAGDESAVPGPQTYRLRSGEWLKLEPARVAEDGRSDDVDVWIDEAFDRPPALRGRRTGDLAGSMVWDPNPQLASIALGKVFIYKWNDKEGFAWSGLLALPPDYVPGTRYPLVIQTHGYDLKKYYADGMYTTGSGGRALVAREIIVLQMDQPMLHIKTPRDGPFAMGGFEAAVSRLTADGFVDPQRVGVIGFSFTCFHTLYALTHHPNLFTAATITDGNNMSYSQYIFDETGGAYQQISDAVNGGPPWGQENLASWASRAPDFNLDKIQTPLLISALERGQLLRQWEPYAGLRRLGKPVDMLWLRREDAPHLLVQPYHRYISQQSAVDWFDFWLNGHEDPVPSKSRQYARWRALRKLQNENREKTTEDKSKPMPQGVN